MPFINATPLSSLGASTAWRALRSKREDRGNRRKGPASGWILLLLSFAAGCDRGEDGPADAPAPAARPAAVPQVSQADAERMLQEKAAAGLRAILTDPDDARYAELRAGTAGAVCGRVDTEQPDGKRSGLRPFVVTPEGVAVISLTPALMLNDPEDLFPDYYIRWCATTAELATLEVSADVNAATPVTDLPGELPELAEASPGSEVAPPPTEPPPPAAPAAPSASLESFSKAVIRGGQPKQ